LLAPGVIRARMGPTIGLLRDVTGEEIATYRETGVGRLDEGNSEAYDIVTCSSNPGDVIVHHSRLVHGSGPNYTTERRRLWRKPETA